MLGAYIIKNIRDQRNYAFRPIVQKMNGLVAVSDERALKEARGGNENYQYLYYQKYIESKWEYKVYFIDNQFYYYKQVPTLKDPDKMKSRVIIDEIDEVKEYAIKAVDAIGLQIASLDFLKSEDKFYLTDIIGIGYREGKVVGVMIGGDSEEIIGVNNRQDLITVENIMRNRPGNIS